MVQGFQYGEPYAAKYLCGYGGATSTTINVTGANGFPLKDYSYYNISVGCVDGNGNVGPLSNVPCGEPVPVADFWYQYYEAGGRAGGLCSTDGVGLPAGTTGLGVLMGAAMVATVRRRRRG
jgi:MYXO-CTERM domain-containing protein